MKKIKKIRYEQLSTATTETTSRMSQLLLPNFIITICGVSSLLAILISLVGINLQLRNYRKPIQQRLVIRIQFMVPLFAICCYISLRWFTLSKFFEPIKESYEAFVIYTFFSLLTHLLGGERNIVVRSSGRAPVKHPWPMKDLLPPVDISDPFTLLNIKRGILQYVWLKPIICLLTAVTEFFRLNKNASGIFNMYFIINLVYNLSVTISLYELALFWKCLYNDLKPFSPWGKFLCVKLIIFASYWQGVVLGLLSWFGILKNEASDSENTLGFAIQNAMLCVELIGFAIGHWYSFSYTEYDHLSLPGCGRLRFLSALRDTTGIGDLVYDFKATLSGDAYDYRQFDSVEALIAHPLSQSRMARFNEGLRYTDSGRQKYWLPNHSRQLASPNIKSPLLSKQRTNSITSSHTSVRALYANSILTVDSKEDDVPVSVVQNYNSIDEDENMESEYVTDLTIYQQAKRERPFGDKNCPVVYDIEAYTHSPSLQRLREQAMARQSV